MKWLFQTFDPNVIENDSYIDELFNNDDIPIVDSLVREATQNTLDERRDFDKPVRLSFSLTSRGDAASLDSYLCGLKLHLDATNVDLSGVDLSNPEFLIVEDFNTSGITGDTARKTKGTNWYGFFWKFGKSAKTGTKGGRRGLGRNVFAICSNLRSFYALTIRAGESQEYLQGISVLGSHSIGGEDFHPQGHFAVHEDGEIAQPITDSDAISVFKKLSAVRRDNEPGLSIVVPFPRKEITADKILTKAVSNYFISIWREDLTIAINGDEIRRDNLKKFLVTHADGDLEDYQNILEFIDDIDTTPSQGVNAVLQDAVGRNLLKDHFSKEDLERLRRKFLSGELVHVILPAIIRKKGYPEVTSRINLYLQKTEGNKRGRDFYLRGNMPVTGEGKFRNRQAYGLLEASDGPMVEMLGDAEGAAHWKWNSQHTDLHGNYDHPQNLVLLIKNSLKDLYDLLTEAGDEVDFQSFAEFFPIDEQSDAGGEDDDDPVIIDTPDRVPGPLEIIDVPGGLKVRGINDNSEESYPLKIDVELAYVITGRNSFGQYREHDFQLDAEDMKVSSSGDLTDLEYARNHMRFIIQSSDFEVTATGFDADRDLDARCGWEPTDA